MNIFELSDYILMNRRVTNLELQKLSYYLYSWIKVFENELTFDVDVSSVEFQAWVYGPVNVELYQQYKDYKSNKILKIDSTFFKNSDMYRFTEIILDYYNDFNSKELVDLTHCESPWINARGGIAKFDSSNSIISSNNIVNYYSNTIEYSGFYSILKENHLVN